MLEIACFNLSSASAAARSGADRIELCENYAAGGVTPKYESLQELRTTITKPINVMIRPRSGNFVYSMEEFEEMKSSIKIFKSLASGFVFGLLEESGCVDATRSQELVQLADPLPCTFHRAFDHVPDFFQATEQIIDSGFQSILTSGGLCDAVTGASNVMELQKRFESKISFILGGRVRSTNVRSLKSQTKLQWYHSAAITEPGEIVDEQEVVRLQKELQE
ncbi:hypothetical protein P154DRAFT_11343 [Amniculicola lignicola CBS 123094]|uniref:Copper homeostasis protein cutC homolog n=1 Tax=Amniculicola lignicola CBS 123094 TaxID=1392246 RepID=A0A6A5X4N3_9PLEO|nr:hypothetical protein P154DRAFT_11343 [Amniculicola lignicola CBS 123094]